MKNMHNWKGAAVAVGAASLLGAGAHAKGLNDKAAMSQLRELCDQLEDATNSRTTEGSEAWLSKIAVDIKDSALFAPGFSKWNLASDSDSDKTSSLRHSGPFFGLGLTLEITNNSPEVLEGDAVYVWATYAGAKGEQTCFASAKEGRSWNAFGNKGKGAWEKERNPSEWPLRPKETKRYQVVDTNCPTSFLLEQVPTSIKYEVYLGFRPLGGDRVVAGPLQTIEKPAGLFRGAPVAAGAARQKVKGKKGTTDVTAYYAWGDHVMVADAKSVWWVEVDDLVAAHAGSTPELAALPATTPAYSTSFGQLTVNVTGWGSLEWKQLAGILDPGDRRLTAQIELSIDASSVSQSLQAAVSAARAGRDAADQDSDAAATAAEAAQAAADAAKGTEDYDVAKEAAKQAKNDAKSAAKDAKAAAKALSAAEKAASSGVKSFLKEQAKQIDCGSFRLEVGRTSLKPAKGSLSAKECKALASGETVSGSLFFDVDRWDMPFALSWKGPGKSPQIAAVASSAIAAIPSE